MEQKVTVTDKDNRRPSGRTVIWLMVVDKSRRKTGLPEEQEGGYCQNLPLSV